jgi:hypothetical protein
MTRRHTVVALAAVACSALVNPAVAKPLPPTSKAPSTGVAPYVLPAAPGVHTRSLLTVGEDVGGYRLVGIPDGLGAFRHGDDVTLFANHELRPTVGVVRAHGQKGAFVSKWQIDRQDHEVEKGADLIKSPVQYFDYNANAYTTSTDPLFGRPNQDGSAPFAFSAAFARFCSNNLTEERQLYNPATGNGYKGRIFFPNEESGDEGRVFGTLTSGTTKQLPRLGLFSWENTIAAFNRGDATVVIGNEDSAAGQLWIYQGIKGSTGDAFDRAGLTNGFNSVLTAAVKTDAEWRSTYGKGLEAKVWPSPINWYESGKDQNIEAAREGLTLNRIEDGAFDPRPGHGNDYYFVTTEGAARPDGSDGGGLWRLRFADVDSPTAGMTLTLLLDGSESWGAGEAGLFKPDNLTIDSGGNLLIQEDPGGNVHLGRIVVYDIDSGRRGVVVRFDPALFSGPSPLTIDEESSGIIDAKATLGPGWFLLDAQVHKAITPDPFGLVEHGQLLSLKVDDIEALYTEAP